MRLTPEVSLVEALGSGLKPVGVLGAGLRPGVSLVEALRMLLVVHSTLAVCVEKDTEVLYILQADSRRNMES